MSPLRPGSLGELSMNPKEGVLFNNVLSLVGNSVISMHMREKKMSRQLVNLARSEGKV